MTNHIQHKVQQAEETFSENRRSIESKMATLSDEKRVFQRQVEQMAEQIRSNARRREESGSSSVSSISSIYNLLEQAQDEGQQIIKKTLYSLEGKLEQNKQGYNKQLASYEEEQGKLKKEGSE